MREEEVDGEGAESVVMVPVQRKGAGGGGGRRERGNEREKRNREERSEGCRDSVGLEWSQSVSMWQSEKPVFREADVTKTKHLALTSLELQQRNPTVETLF